MKKKEKYCSIFMTTLMITIPSGAVIALLIEIFSISGIYKVLTDLGSFIAGIVGVVGVLILIWHQNKTTREMIHSNIHVMKHEALETQKAKAFEHAANIGYRFQSLTIGSNGNFNTLIKSDTVIYQYLNQHNKFTQIYGPEDLYHNFNSFSNNDICGFLTHYMHSVIMPTLIHNITLIDINYPTE